MTALPLALPKPVRRVLALVRKEVLVPLRRRSRPAARPSANREVSADALVTLLFPGCAENVPPALLREVVPDGVVHTLTQLRELLARSERQAAPSPVTVRFGPDDVVFRDFGSFKLFLDKADPAVSAYITERDVWEPHISEVVHRVLTAGMTFVDVGANVGWFTMLAASLVGPSGRVIAVEPWSENCRLLVASVRINDFSHVEIWPFALDRCQRWANFMTHVGSNGGLISDTADVLGSGRGTIVPAFALDELLGADTHIHLMKLDVEGAEHRVLTGAQQTLERCRPIVITEFSLEMMRRVSDVEPTEYLHWFTSRGWKLNVIDRTSRQLRPFRTPAELIAWWPTMFHQEDLLFIPS